MTFADYLLRQEVSPDNGWPMTAGPLDSDLNYVTVPGADSKGSWTEAIAALPRGCSALVVSCYALDSTTVLQALLDVGIGAAGSEIAIAENLQFSTQVNSVVGGCCQITIPASLPRGTRIALRAQKTEFSSANTRWAVRTCHIFGANNELIETYGANTTTTGGVVVVAGSSGSLGSWYELAGALRRSAKGLLVAFGNNESAATEGYWRLQIGRGVAGQEQPIYNAMAASTFHNYALPSYFEVPVSLPRGERVSCRGAFQYTSTNGKNRSVVLYALH